MDIKAFKVESWMNDHEEKAIYNLAESSISSLTIKELLELCQVNPTEFWNELQDTRLTYGSIFGSAELLSGIQELYHDIDKEDILPMHGAVGANNLVINALVKPGDNVIAFIPTFQQHYSIPESLGAEVRFIYLKEENGFLPDIEELKAVVDDNTSLISFDNPNNPTGTFIPDDLMKEIAAIAEKHDAYLAVDEIYRGINEEGTYMSSVIDLYDKAIAIGGMSKMFSVAGLRIGWIASHNKELMAIFRERRDYDTISCGIIDEKLAALALANRETIFERNRNIIKTNRKILDDWVNATDEVYYVKPDSGTTALVFYKKDMPSYDLCLDLIDNKGLLFAPGSAFELEHCVRVGYAFDGENLKKGLEIFADYLKAID